MSEVTPNKDRLRLWVGRLESGQDKQVKKYMGVDNLGYCCLGVLNEVAIENGVPLSRTVDSAQVIAYNGESGSYIPNMAAEWFGVDYYVMTGYANMNDKGMSFKEIATEVRKNFDL